MKSQVYVEQLQVHWEQEPFIATLSSFQPMNLQLNQVTTVLVRTLVLASWVCARNIWWGGNSRCVTPRVGRLTFQVGSRATQVITIDLGDFGKGGPITNDVTGDVDESLDNMNNRINSRESAEGVLERLDAVMDKVNANRANMGAVINRLTHAIDNLSNVSTNQSASRSQIMDADYAKASTELARSQILQQAGTAILAQANASQQVVLQLLNG